MILCKWIIIQICIMTWRCVCEDMETMEQFLTFFASQTDQIERVRIYTYEEYFHILFTNPDSGENRAYDGAIQETGRKIMGFMFRILDLEEYFRQQSHCDKPVSRAFTLELQVEDDFMEKAPTNPKDVLRFIEEVPYWTAKKHGKKYRLMYQVYTLPKYIEYGKKFFEGVNERYTEYAKQLEPKIGIPHTVITPLIFIFVRACVHYAMFEDEYYLKTQMEVLKQAVALFADKYRREGFDGGDA